MSKFWVVVTGLLVLGVGLIFTAGGEDNINFTDLETECRYDRSSEVNVELEGQNSLRFSGHFPVENPDSTLGYEYTVSGGEIKLDVFADRVVEGPEEFFNNCRAVGVYNAETGSLDSGSYHVKVFHEGERVDERVIRLD